MVYGSNGMFGAVNVITRKGAEVGGTELAAELASGEGRRARVTFAQARQWSRSRVVGNGLEQRRTRLAFP